MPIAGDGGQYDTTVDAILSATERLFSSMGNAQEMVRQAKILAEATSSLVNSIKLEAENETDPGNARLLTPHASCDVHIVCVCVCVCVRVRASMCVCVRETLLVSSDIFLDIL